MLTRSDSKCLTDPEERTTLQSVLVVQLNRRSARFKVHYLWQTPPDINFRYRPAESLPSPVDRYSSYSYTPPLSPPHPLSLCPIQLFCNNCWRIGGATTDGEHATTMAFCRQLIQAIAMQIMFTWEREREGRTERGRGIKGKRTRS